MKALIKSALYRTGALKAIHRSRNRDWLTVLMFHRVLPDGRAEWAGANPTYTVTTDFFDAVLVHVRRFYSPVSAGDVRRALVAQEPLPPQPLLITFDDGWADNFEHALPILRKHDIPALFFVATDAIRRGEAFWQETLYAWGRSTGTSQSMWEAGLGARGAEFSPRTHNALSDLIARLEADGDGPEVVRKLQFDEPSVRPRMMAVADLQTLEKDPLFDVGAHGASHTPLTKAVDPAWELRSSRDSLREWFGVKEGDPLVMSFPHGQYNEEILHLARQTGFDLVFDSRKVLSSVESLSGGSAIGRFEIRPQGCTFDAGRIASEMAFRPRDGISGAPS